MISEIVPFGKYKGQPVEALVADPDYCEWLIAQPWFTTKYRNVYNVIINYGAEPQDSPEHNQMQAQFLEDEWCFALADVIDPKRTYSSAAAQAVLEAEFEADPVRQNFRQFIEQTSTPAQIHRRNFECGGWDVIYNIAAARISTNRTSLVPPLPACTCRCDHADCAEHSRCRGGDWMAYCKHRYCKPDSRGIDKHNHCTPGCYWLDGGELSTNQREWLRQPGHCYSGGYYDGPIHVELKPDIGDDYPSVLRQVKGFRYDYGARCVVARRHAFQHVTWEDVQKIFRASGIHLIAESSIT